MIGIGAATPGSSAMDQAMTLLQTATNPEAVKKRLHALDEAKLKHDRAKHDAEKAHEELDAKWTQHLVKEGELNAREAEIAKREVAAREQQASAVANAARIADEQSKLAAELKAAQTKLAEDVVNFSRHRESQIAAIQAKAAQADKLHGAADEDRALVKQEREALELRKEKMTLLVAQVREKLNHL